MAIYLPVKFEFDWTKQFRVGVRKRKCWWTGKRTKNGQTKGQNYTNFESNLAMMIIYLPIKFELNWTKRFRVRVRKRKCWQTDKWTNEQTELHQFQKQLSYDEDLSPCQVWIRLDKAISSWVWKRKCWWTGKQTKNGQTKGLNYTNFQRNLAMMAIYLPVKLKFDWTKRFQVSVRKRKSWRTSDTPI